MHTLHVAAIHTIMSFSSVLVESLHKTHTVSWRCSPIYGVQQGAGITEYQWLNEARALSDVPQHWLFGGNTESETTLWRDNNAPRWTAGQHRACSVVPIILVAITIQTSQCRRAPLPFFPTCCKIWQATEYFCSRVYSCPRCNKSSWFYKKENASVYTSWIINCIIFSYLHYLWAICCSVTAIWIKSIKLTLLRIYDPWPRLLINFLQNDS